MTTQNKDIQTASVGQVETIKESDQKVLEIDLRNAPEGETLAFKIELKAGAIRINARM